MMKRLVFLTIGLMIALPVFAQDNGGQFWVQAFEDRNGNGQLDAGEPFLTHGVSVDLLNAEGIVMASGTLDDAPYASRGYVGFLYLAPGKYSAVITSADLTPTTPDHVDVDITAGAAPITAMFGAQKAAAADASESSATSSLLNSELARIALSGFGALSVIGVMVIIGLLIYLLVLRRRAPVDFVRTSSGIMRAVSIDETGEMRKTGERNRS
ncbi:MAG: hypothetical protein GC204_15310 [Chloroflexi bacterium]|nr:hypothetical protein [Chloroflexota bacterium]